MNEKTLIRIIADLTAQLITVLEERDRYKQWWLDEEKKNKAKEVSA